MNLNIGKNIKMLRQQKGITQEQLADLLCISSAAVSKWEAKNTYPDITMLVPLAEVFCVSVDELLGYDKEKAKKDIDRIINEYHIFHQGGRLDEATAIIIAARKQYPYDFRIMSAYMWDKAGGNVGTNIDALNKNSVEFTQICDCILNKCDDENLRIGALNMKAKLLYAQGDTNSALTILSKLPTWGNSSEQRTEQLFDKNTSEFRYWNKRNCYGLMDAMAIKLARTIKFDNSLSLVEKLTKIESMADAFSELSTKSDLGCVYIVAQSIYSMLAGMLTAKNSITDIIRIREKQFAVLERITALTQTDFVLKECIERTYHTDNIAAWTVDMLLNSPLSQFARLRENSEYMTMLKKWHGKVYA